MEIIHINNPLFQCVIELEMLDTTALYCFLHLMWAAIQLSIDRVSLNVPSLFLNLLSTSSWVLEPPGLESPVGIWSLN